MRIALIQPASPFLLDQGVHGPLGLWYVGAALQGAGHEVVYCDRGLGDALPTGCDVWGLTGTTPQLRDMALVLAEAGETPVIVGGPHATQCPDDLLSLGATVVVRGEGEQAFPRLLSGTLPRMAVMNADRIANLNSLAFPDRSQAHRYHYQIKDRYGVAREAATVITSRGCPHRCAFCSTGVWGRRYSERSADNVLTEMVHLQGLGYEGVHFYDDSLAINRARLRQIAAGMKRLGLIWRCFVRADQVDQGLLGEMAQGGCVEIGLGVESGAQSVLDASDKYESVEGQAQTIAAAHRAGIRVKAFIIVGLPGETWETVDATAWFLGQTRPDDVDITVLQVYPGSPIDDDPAAYGITRTAEPCWYKGRGGEYRANHRTEALGADDILVARDYLEARFKGVAV